MNILFFLTPKNEVAYINTSDTIRQALEKMEYHGYTAIPLIDEDGRYIGTVTEGDMLWYIKNESDLTLHKVEAVSIVKVKRKHDNKPVNVDSYMEDLIEKAMNQNFVPVIDDNKIFIGIITRKDIISYMYKKLRKNS